MPDATATLGGIAKLQSLADSWDQGQNQNVFLIKTDHQLNTNNRLTLRYNHQNFNGKNFENAGPQNAVEHTGDSNVRTRTLNAGVTTDEPAGNRLAGTAGHEAVEGMLRSLPSGHIVLWPHRHVCCVLPLMRGADGIEFEKHNRRSCHHSAVAQLAWARCFPIHRGTCLYSGMIGLK